AFLTDNNFASLADVPVDVLTQVLLNHVVAGTNLSTGLSTSYVSSSSTAGAGGNALSLYINTSNGVSINGVSDVVTPDVVASNGVVHIVDAVIGLPDVVDHAVANTDLSELVGALTANGNTTFTDLLSDDNTDFTVFAPVNSAFAAFSNPNNNELDNILSNHVIVGAAAASSGLSNSYLNTAGENGDGDNLSIYINTDNGVTLNGVSTVAAADIVATNGIIHAVDAVIDIPTVVTFAVADPTFAPLVTALTEGTPDTDFVTVLNGNGPFTVFAPTNTAFDNLLTALNLSEVTEIEQGLLTSVLNHHVVSGNIRSGDLNNPGDTVAPTLEGDNITITLPGTDNGVNIADVTDGAGNSGIGIIAVDVQAGNGVIHVLDTVLLPDTNN
ncbi:MAG: fasciclin domain-containing protein, partial [Eudoraea sp.]|nr:fasciclin domain-containing protein [Eudoraea sp.]NNJ39403.1 fasciclin domain-containing protein [Eudoraea sp.]